jgi:hypothetical protein
MSTPSQAAKTEAAKQAVMLAFMIIGVIVIMAIQNPDFLQTWRMRLSAASSRLLSAAAWRAGRAGMEIELSTGYEKYGLPFALSQMRDRAKARYDRARGEY